MEAVKRLCGGNLSTDRLLTDPLIQLVMEADRVNPGELGNLLRTLHARHDPNKDRSLPIEQHDAHTRAVGVIRARDS